MRPKPVTSVHAVAPALAKVAAAASLDCCIISSAPAHARENSEQLQNRMQPACGVQDRQDSMRGTGKPRKSIADVQEKFALLALPKTLCELKGLVQQDSLSCLDCHSNKIQSKITTWAVTRRTAVSMRRALNKVRQGN